MSDVVQINEYPFEFNPPLHPSLRLFAPSLAVTGESGRLASLRDIYDETGNTYGANATDKGGDFYNLRLGRIVMGKEAMGWAIQQRKYRFGFRFAFNPETVTGGTSVGTDFIPDPSNTITTVLQEGLEVIRFELLLNRTPDVVGKAPVSSYTPQITEDERKAIQERGTHYDLEYLYRVANGMQNTNARDKTGDIGVLLPNPCVLHLGPFRSRGALWEISATDTMFSEDMVPILTYVQVAFTRYLTMKGEDQIEQLKAVGAKVSDGSGDTPQAGAKIDPGTVELSGRQVYDLATAAGFPPGDANTATQIAWAESGWKADAHNNNPNTGDNSYGLWQINLIVNSVNDGNAIREKYGLANNDALKDPATNARVAYDFWRTRGFSPWSVYNSGKYKEAPWPP